MDIFVNYLLESSIILGVLGLFYRFVLHHESLFKFNRVYLLLSLLLAAVIPFLHISTSQVTEAVQVNFVNLLQTVNVYTDEVKQTIIPVLTGYGLFIWLYLFGVIALFVRLVVGLVRLGGLSRKAVWQTQKGIKLADLPGHFNPFSFFHFIFINRSLYSNNDLDKILVHEMAHVRFKHSIDVVLIELLLIVQWFNPFAWLIRHLLKELHEFQADKSVLDEGASIGVYKELLLFQATGTRLLPVNNFNHSITKKRFKMMTNKTLKNRSFLKITLAISVIIGVGIFFSCDNEEANNIQDSELKSAENSMEKPVFSVVEVMPAFPGGAQELRKFIAKTVKYPVKAQELGIQGRVYVQFVVDHTGKVTNVEVVRGVHETINAEALRVINSMPDWTPGMQGGENVDVEFTVPINFVLESKKEERDNDELEAKAKDEVVVVSY